MTMEIRLKITDPFDICASDRQPQVAPTPQPSLPAGGPASPVGGPAWPWNPGTNPWISPPITTPGVQTITGTPVTPSPGSDWPFAIWQMQGQAQIDVKNAPVNHPDLDKLLTNLFDGETTTQKWQSGLEGGTR